MSINTEKTAKVGLEVAEKLMAGLIVPLNQSLTDEQMQTVLHEIKMAIATGATIGYMRGISDILEKAANPEEETT